MFSKCGLARTQNQYFIFKLRLHRTFDKGCHAVLSQDIDSKGILSGNVTNC